MPVSLVLTLIGPDRPGLVERVAATVADHDGNWLESRMARLAGKFTGLLRVSVPRDRLSELLEALEGLRAEGLRVVAEPVDAPLTATAGRVASLDLVGTDHPGIVRAISRALARRGVNVEELSTEYEGAPMSGEPMFRASARLQLPAELTLEALRGELEGVAQDLMVDVTLG